MQTALWIAQFVLAGVFVMAGAMKLTQPVDRLAEKMAFVGRIPASRVRLAGVFDILGGIGVLLPQLLGVATWLVPVAGFGLVVLMALAAFTQHLPHGEAQMAAGNALLAGLALFVALGRL